MDYSSGLPLLALVYGLLWNGILQGVGKRRLCMGAWYVEDSSTSHQVKNPEV